MNKYVVAIISMFEMDLKQFIIEANSEYDAVKKGMLLYSDNNKYEVEWQNDESYPKTFEGLVQAYEEMPFSVIKI